jgi:prepilin-type N-terminal cleavage/methylation domain-containing protein
MKNSKGLSLVEMLIALGIMGIMMLAMSNMFNSQLKSNNYLEFQLKRIQLQGIIFNQFLNNPNNCACLFNGAAEFPVGGTAVLAGVAPTQIVRYTSAAPGCATAPDPYVNNVGIDGLRTTAIELRNITDLGGGLYDGNFVVGLQSTKDISGPKDLNISIRVSINTGPGSPGNRVFTNCAAVSPVPPFPVPIQVTTPLLSCGGAPVPTALPCPAGQRPISCGLRDDLENSNEDFASCYLDLGTNSCMGQRDESGGGCDAMTLFCYCVP